MSSPEQLTDIVLIEGPPGAGKGFLSAQYLKENPLAQHISAGQRVRDIRSGELVSVHTPTVLECLSEKKYLPDDVFGGIVLEAVAEGAPRHALSLVDGFPYSNGDFEYVQERLRRSGHRVLGAVCLDATVETCVERMAYRGMRDGEGVRKEVLFSAAQSEREYYVDRYDTYNRGRERLRGVIDDGGVRVVELDVNPDILSLEPRRRIVGQIALAIQQLQANNLIGERS